MLNFGSRKRRKPKKFEVSDRVWADVHAKAGVKFGGQGTAKVTYKAYVGDTGVKSNGIRFRTTALNPPTLIYRHGMSATITGMSYRNLSLSGTSRSRPAYV